MTVLGAAIPLLANAVVVAAVVAPLCGGSRGQRGAGVRVRRRSTQLLGNADVEPFSHFFEDAFNANFLIQT